MKRKLELKDITPYLLYNLKLVKQIYKSGNCQRVTIMKPESIQDVLRMVNKNAENKCCFPILRPLSDLTKEIEVNGEKFVPYYWFEKLGYSCSLVFEKVKIERTVYESYYISEHCYCDSEINKLPYDIIKKLLEWHFDVFGLIEEGLAIDINTLKK